RAQPPRPASGGALPALLGAHGARRQPRPAGARAPRRGGAGLAGRLPREGPAPTGDPSDGGPPSGRVPPAAGERVPEPHLLRALPAAVLYGVAGAPRGRRCLPLPPRPARVHHVADPQCSGRPEVPLPHVARPRPPGGLSGGEGRAAPPRPR